MKKTETFKLFGIFGYPLGHTLSPYMHEAGFHALGIDANYIVLELNGTEFRKAMRSLGSSLFSGFNVTVPYKETILGYLDCVSPEARAIGAVNTVFRKRNHWVGTNTDMEGFLISLAKEGRFDPKGKKAVVLGAGGASRAITYGLSKKRIKKLVIVDSVPGKAYRIVRDLSRIFSKTEYDAFRAGTPLLREFLVEADLVVNATPLGLKKTDPLVVPAAWIPKAFGRPKLFMDLIYNPAETKFLKIAREHGHRTLNGCGMLLYQGVRAFEYWTHRKAPVFVMQKAFNEALGAQGKP